MSATIRGYPSRRGTATPYDDGPDESESFVHRLKSNDVGLFVDRPVDVLGGLPELHYPPTSWDRFDLHIRCITTSDPWDQYCIKKSTDKASETYKATIRDFYGSFDRASNFSDSEEELSTFANVVSRDDAIPRPWKGKEAIGRGDEPKPEDEKMMSQANSENFSFTEKHRQNQQQTLDEQTFKRMLLYEKYLERKNAWADGLTKSGKEILMEIQRRKGKRSTRFQSFSATEDLRSSKNLSSSQFKPKPQLRRTYTNEI